MKDLEYYMTLKYPFILEQDEDGSFSYCTLTYRVA